MVTKFSIFVIVRLLIVRKDLFILNVFCTEDYRIEDIVLNETKTNCISLRLFPHLYDKNFFRLNQNPERTKDKLSCLSSITEKSERSVGMKYLCI